MRVTVNEVRQIIRRMVEKTDILSGGLADEKEPSDYDPYQLTTGIEVEMEHTDDPEMSREIAMDHLEEIPDYYDRLEKMERDTHAGVKEGIIWVEVGQLRQMIHEEIEFVNKETGRIIDLDNDAMARDLARRLRLGPMRVDTSHPGPETWELSPEQFEKVRDELHRKPLRRSRARPDPDAWRDDLRQRAQNRIWDRQDAEIAEKEAAAEAAAEAAREELQNSAFVAGQEYKADNPNADVGVAWDLASMFQYDVNFEQALETIFDARGQEAREILIGILADEVARGIGSMT